MEFNEKLQELRKQKNLTQEELAEVLYVSRTAVSKWESGRGYPNIDSLKEISRFFSVTIDDLLSSGEILNIAEDDNKQREKHFRSLAYVLLDISVLMLLFLLFFRQKADGFAQPVSLLSLSSVSFLLLVCYYAAVVFTFVYGILILAFQNCCMMFLTKNSEKISLILNATSVLLFIISSQPYAGVLLFVFLVIKSLMLIKWQ